VLLIEDAAAELHDSVVAHVDPVMPEVAPPDPQVVAEAEPPRRGRRRVLVRGNSAVHRHVYTVVGQQ
jgi:hypothetical protein